MSSRKRSQLYDEESREGTDDTNLSDSSEISNKRNKIILSHGSGKNDVANKIAIATARVILGLSNKNQTLNKNLIAKILEAENEKGSGLQFKKFVLPILNQIFDEIFNYKIIELPSKKSKLSQNPKSTNNINNKKESDSTIKNVSSDDFILINNLPPSLRALNYSFMAEYTEPIGKSLKAMDKPKQNSNNTNIYGENLPRPTINIVENGITLLIICIILLHNNNILQSDLILILKTKFGLTFKENEIVSILGNQTLNEFLTMLNKQDYIDRSLITNASNSNTNGNNNSNLSRSINSKNFKYDDNMLIIKLGRRCFVEWGIEEFVGLFRQLMQDQWTEQLQESVIFTVNSVWKP